MITSSNMDQSNGVRRAYALTFFLLMEAIEQVGSDRALGMLQRALEKQADVIARELKGEVSGIANALDLGVEVYTRFMGEAGARVEMHGRDQTSATFRVRQCPFYEALLDVGADCGYLQSGLCSNLILNAVQTILTRFDPRLRLETRLMRQSAEEFCLERIFLVET